VLLYASGANTQVVAFSNGKYRVFGETLDLGIGNFLDKLAREMGFGFPGGPEIEKKAKDGDYMELPYSIKGMDVSFSGMGTKVKQLLSKGVSIDATRSFRSSGTNNQGHDKVVRNLCFSVQETAFAMLVEAAERALAHTGKKELVLGGGVGCNARLQEMCEKMCADRGAEFFCPERGLLVDNGAMIAYLGEVMLRAEKEKGGRKFSKPGDTDVLVVKPRERTDHVKVTWR
jgi:glycoprotease/Kae1 family metallohydrolase